MKQLYPDSPRLNILLIQAPIEDFYTTKERHYPLGLLTLAASVQDLPVNLRILDFLHHPGRSTLPLPPNFAALKPFLVHDRGPLSAFHQYYHFGLSWKEIRQSLAKESPHICGISSNFYTYTASVLKLAALIKELHPLTSVVVGGQNVNDYHSLLIEDPHIDCLISGPGEIPFRNYVLQHPLLQAPESQGLPDLSDPAAAPPPGGAVSPARPSAAPPSDVSASLSASPENTCSSQIPAPFPLPNAELLPPDAYRISGKNAVMLNLTRGCPMACSFCTVHESFGRQQQLLPVPVVIDFMRRQIQRGILAFDIEDDNFTFSKSYAHAFLDALLRELPPVALYAMNGIDSRFLDTPLLKKMRSAGFSMLNLSLAVSSDEHQQQLSRPLDLQRFSQVCTTASDLGFRIITYFISGLPGTSPTDVLSTMAFLAARPSILGISPFYWIPGMPLSAPNTPSLPEDARLSRFFPADPRWPEPTHITLFRLARLINALKSLPALLSSSTPATLTSASKLLPDGHILKISIEQRKLYGLNADKSLFLHQSDENLLSEFFELFDQLPLAPASSWKN